MMTKVVGNILTFLLIIEYFSIPVNSTAPDIDYCFLKCEMAPEKVHAVCRRTHVCKPAKHCVEYQADANFREQILHAHNAARDQVANGSIRGRYGNSGAKNMNVLSYDMELEFIASCSINACDSYPVKHGCYDSERFPVSRSVGYHWTNDWVKLLNQTLQSFAVRVVDIKNVTLINNYQYDMDADREPFIRMVWAETKYIGCSAVIDRDYNFPGMVACTYGPAAYAHGNTVYKMAYTKSEIASECPDGRNEIYKSLCGKINPIPTEHMWNYYPDLSKATSHWTSHLNILILIINVIVNYF